MHSAELHARLNARLRIARQGMHDACQWLKPAADQPTPQCLLDAQRREALALLQSTIESLDTLQEKDPIEYDWPEG